VAHSIKPATYYSAGTAKNPRQNALGLLQIHLEEPHVAAYLARLRIREGIRLSWPDDGHFAAVEAARHAERPQFDKPDLLGVFFPC
jgi:hypothetical protein